MPSGTPRRQFLRTVGIFAAGALGGCAGAGHAGRSYSVTPAPIPSDPPTPTPHESPAEPDLQSTQIVFDVTVLEAFSELSPARVGISVTNTSTHRLHALARSRYVLPFLDNDYTGTDRTGDPALFLAPDESQVIVEPGGEPPQRLGAALPDSSVDDCWILPFDWPAARQSESAPLEAVSLPPGGTRAHRYSLFFIDECESGEFTFVNSFDMVVGNIRPDTQLYRARFEFVLTLTENLEAHVDILDPVIGRPSGDRGRK